MEMRFVPRGNINGRWEFDLVWLRDGLEAVHVGVVFGDTEEKGRRLAVRAALGPEMAEFLTEELAGNYMVWGFKGEKCKACGRVEMDGHHPNCPHWSLKGLLDDLKLGDKGIEEAEENA